jgi:hypothetical protein
MQYSQHKMDDTGRSETVENLVLTAYHSTFPRNRPATP